MYEFWWWKLCKCRSLIHRLEGVDLRKMKHEEKLAFWINVHNALVMHVWFFSTKEYLTWWFNIFIFLLLFSLSLCAYANHVICYLQAFLIYGIPQNNLKRVSMPLKVNELSLTSFVRCTILLTSFHFFQAAYNVGGHTISVDMIQRSILGCRLPRPGQVISLSEETSSYCILLLFSWYTI